VPGSGWPGALSPAFREAACAALPVVGRTAIEAIGERIIAGVSADEILQDHPLPREAAAVEKLLAARAAADVAPMVAGAFLIGLAAGSGHAESRQRVQAVWSGPSTARVPVRATAQVVQDVIAGARNELLLMTYSAKPYEPVLAALAAAVERGVKVAAIVETLQGAGSAISGPEPAAAFASIAGLELWHWPVPMRTENGSKMHAKLVVADRSVLFTTSANLTAGGVTKNIEAGLLIEGGEAPRRTAEHVAALQSTGALERLHVG